MSTPSTPRRRFTGLRAVALSAATVLLLLAPRARAEDGPEGEEGGPQGLEKQIRAQMDKILKLMRENEAALLEVSQHGGKASKGPEVEIPPSPEGGAAAMGAGASGMGGGAPPEGGTAGEEARRKMEELLKATQGRGGAVPKEIEELIKMIPVRGGGGGGGGNEKSQPENERRKGDQRKPEDESKEPKDGEQPKDPRKGDQKPEGGKKPNDGEKGEPPENPEPAWFAELPEEARRAITGGSVEDVPAKYRALLERYRKWLAEKARPRESR